ncbi:hypothetical protein K469DRAFT_692611 [Zopfia rhizophila CBS 207.26]|uniref:SGNH hydrolase-type esterase domain-containing protein n=1 Tax=Zopfia rhizophila CBS 207.26 TaxID=1314779 RepID=A0A6A6DR52_9PEZI|nr:hypothetical protein K469DRAFT_692611 [Zopfia rhizophila CBS 207.26]
MGDSFSAGPGAGKEYDPNRKSGKCMRRDQAYGPTLQRDAGMIGPEGPGLGKPVFRFSSCTGHTTENLLDFTDPVNNQENQVHDDTTFVTLSIGGNNVLFADVLEICIYRGAIRDIEGKCSEKKIEAYTQMFGKDFHRRYNKVLDLLVTEKFA